MTRDPQPTPGLDRATDGALYAIGAFLMWGVFPIYVKWVDQVPSMELVAHRIVWSLLLVALLLAFRKGWTPVRSALANRRMVATLTASAVLVAANWLIFIWAVANDRVLETSLGYFINPLVNVVLGVVFLRERLRRWQWAAVLLAALGIGNLVVGYGQAPWVALGLALAFGLYGLIRKVARVDAVGGLFVETLILCPPALGYLVYLEYTGVGAFGRLGWEMDGLLALSCVVTALPLILFARAAKRLRLSTLGFFMYITPTCQFALAVFLFAEPFTRAHGVTFGCIWLALAIYTADTSLEARRSARRP